MALHIELLKYHAKTHCTAKINTELGTFQHKLQLQDKCHISVYYKRDDLDCPIIGDVKMFRDSNHRALTYCSWFDFL